MFSRLQRPVLNLAFPHTHYATSPHCLCLRKNPRPEEATVSWRSEIAGGQTFEWSLASPRLTSRSLAEVAEMTRTQRRMSTPMEGLSRARGSWGGGFMQVLVEFFHLTATKHFPSNTQTSQAESHLHHPGEWQRTRSRISR